MTKITMPKDALKIQRARATEHESIRAFRFTTARKRVIFPRELLKKYKDLSIDLFVSPKEKCLYIQYVPAGEGQFKASYSTGILISKKLFEWFRNAEVAVHDDYAYADYVVDENNRLVKLSLNRR